MTVATHAVQGQESLGVFKVNRQLPIHRWYPFVEGYSATLVEQILHKHRADRRLVVFDPFGGSGTTPLAAAFLGLDTLFAEVNPYLAWVSQTKVNAAREAVGSGSANDLNGFIQVVSTSFPKEATQSHPLVRANQRRTFFPDGTAEDIAATLEWISEHLDGPSAEICKLAVATALVPSSNMIRRTDLRRRTSSDPTPESFRHHLKRSLAMFADDLVSTAGTVRGQTRLVATDVRGLDLETARFDLIITSPPYLNGTNYFRNTKLELLALGFIDDESELGDLRSQCITAGINNVTKRRSEPTRFEAVERYAATLDAIAYDRRIPTMVRGYFSDMFMALSAIRLHSQRSASFYLDIGDSRFSGIHIPTDMLMIEVARLAGWAHTASDRIRARQSYDGHPLKQVLLQFQAA